VEDERAAAGAPLADRQRTSSSIENAPGRVSQPEPPSSLRSNWTISGGSRLKSLYRIQVGLARM
jgi:hypothetical protein